MVFDGGIHEDSAHPPFKGAVTPEAFQVAENLHESVLQDILGLIGLRGVAQTNSVHLCGESVVQDFLHPWISSQTSCYQVAFRDDLVVWQVHFLHES